MYRKIFTPNEQDSSIPLAIPREWYGQPVEVIIFPLVDTDDALPLHRDAGAGQTRKKEKTRTDDENSPRAHM